MIYIYDDRHTYTNTHIDIQTHRQINIHIDIQTYIHAYRHTGRLTVTPKDRQRDRRTYIYT